MRHSLASLPSVRPLPPGFTLRTAHRDDADGLAKVLTAAFDEPWTPERVQHGLLDDPGVPVTFLIEREGEIVATASYQEQAEPDPMAGWVHWVGVHPDARGHGLGEIVSARVVAEAADRGRSCVLLTTDDPRLPAIRTYLKLGFVPDSWHGSHEKRWDGVMKKIGDGESSA